MKCRTKNRSVVVGLLAGTGMVLACAADGTKSPWEWDGEYWGAETNGVKAGLYIQHLSGTTNIAVVRCTPVLLNTRTNNGNSRPDRLKLWTPPTESCYQLTLLDSNQQPVAKTARGKALGKPLSQPLALTTGFNSRAGYSGAILIPDWPQPLYPSILLQDYFVIPKPGKYGLRFEMRVIWIQRGVHVTVGTTNLPLVQLPTVEAQLELQ